MTPPPRDAIGVVVVGQPLMRIGLQLMYAGAPETDLVAEARADELESVLAGLAHRPDVAVIVCSGPDDPVRTWIDTAHRRFGDLPVMVLLHAIEPELALTALECGATGCYVLDAEERDLITATVAVVRGGTPIDPRLARYVIEHTINGARHAELLTAREAEVLELVWSGLSNKQIARELGITEPTVKAYLTRVYQRIGVRSRTEAAMWEEARRQARRPMVLAS